MKTEKAGKAILRVQVRCWRGDLRERLTTISINAGPGNHQRREHKRR